MVAYRAEEDWALQRPVLEGEGEEERQVVEQQNLLW